jgi:hypothetical protein
MDDESIPAPTPEKGSGEKAAASDSNQESEAKPKEEIKPRKRQTQKWFGLTKTQWRELAGILILIPWVWNDLIDSHIFSKLCLLAFSLAVAQGLACSFLKSRTKALSLWLVSLIPLAAVVWINSRPESKPYPNFKFYAFIGENPDDVVGLTNNFLFLPAAIGTNDFYFDGVLIVPTQIKQTNIVFNLGIQNDSSVLAEDIEITISASSNLMCVPDARWWKVTGAGFFLGWDIRSRKPLAIETWGEEIPDILPGNARVLPSISLKTLGDNDWAALGVMVRARDSPTKILAFNLIFEPVQKPFVTQSIGQQRVLVPSEMLK